MLFLVTRRVEPLWGNGHISVALTEGNDKKDAIDKAINAEDSDHSKYLKVEYRAIGLNQGFVKLNVIEDIGE